MFNEYPLYHAFLLSNVRARVPETTVEGYRAMGGGRMIHSTPASASKGNLLDD